MMSPDHHLACALHKEQVHGTRVPSAWHWNSAAHSQAVQHAAACQTAVCWMRIACCCSYLADCWGGDKGVYRDARGASCARLRAPDICHDLREKPSALGCKHGHDSMPSCPRHV